MLILASTADKINLVTSSSANTEVQVSYADFLAGAVTLGRKNTAIVAAATTDISGSPAASTQRNIKHISIRNKHASTLQNVTLQHFDGTNTVELFGCVLLAGHEMIYDGEGGFRCYNTAGSLRFVQPGVITTIAISDDTTTNATMYPVWVSANTGNLAPKVSSTKLKYNPSTGVLDFGGISCRVTKASATSFTTGTQAAIAFDTELWDNDTIHDNATNNTRLTCRTAGKYWVWGQVRVQSNSAGQRELAILLNGTSFWAVDQRAACPSAATDVTVGTFMNLAVGDYVELYFDQTSGSTLNIERWAEWSPEFMMVRISS